MNALIFLELLFPDLCHTMHCSNDKHHRQTLQHKYFPTAQFG